MAFVGGSLQPPPFLGIGTTATTTATAAAAARPARCCWVAPRPTAASFAAAARRSRLPVTARPATVGPRGRRAPRAAAAGGGSTDELYPEPDPYVPPPPTVPGRSGGGQAAAPAGANRWTSSAAPAEPSSPPSAPYVVPPGGTPGYGVAPADAETAASTTAGATFDTAAAAASLWRFGWIAWWSQFVLTTIAGVILVFSFAFPGVIVATSASKLGTLLAAIGVATGLVSNVWTYGYTRLSLSLGRAATAGGGGAAKTAAATATGIRNRLRVGVGIALAGLTVSLLGVQAIVGTLLARLLSSGFGEAYGSAGVVGRVPGGVQPVDILVVQAAANGMLGLLCALGISLWLATRVNKWAAGIGGKAK